METIKSIIRHIRNIKKKRSEKELTFLEAHSSHGLTENFTETLVDTLVRDFVLFGIIEGSFITA